MKFLIWIALAAFFVTLGVLPTLAVMPACSDFRIRTYVTELPAARNSNFQYFGPQLEVILFLADAGKLLYASFDAGQTWTPQIFANGVEFNQITTSTNRTFILVNAKNGDVYYASFYETSLETKQLAWQRSTPPARLIGFLPHPSDEDGIIAVAPAMSGSQYDLYYSANFGRTWRLIRRSIFGVTWAAAGKYGLPENRLFVHENADSSGQTNDWSKNKLVVSTNLFATEATVVFEGLTQFISVDDDLFVARPRLFGSRYDTDLFVSENGGASWHKVALPFESVLSQTSWIILDAEDRSIFVGVDHGTYTYTSIYAADALTGSYRLSLTRVPRSPLGFSRVRGLYGFYIANQYIDEPSTEAVYTPTRSVISFDEGAFWHPIPAPLEDQSQKCSPDEVCQLNFYGSVLSRPSAIGIVIGFGEVGSYLSANVSAYDTFISGDGGKSFKKLRSGLGRFEIVNHGSMIVMFPLGATNVMAFADDEGIHTTECNFLQGALADVIVDSITIDPDAALPIALVSAHRQEANGVIKQYLITIDVTRAQEYLCSGYDSPDTATSDYELWFPSDYRGNTCILGRRVVYERKKRDRDCLNPISYRPQFLNQSCPCSLNDYYCDQCFERDFASGKCFLSPLCEGIYNPFEPPSPCQGTWIQSSGHLLLPGDYCSPNAGFDIGPREQPCPQTVPDPLPSSPVSRPEINPVGPPAAVPTPTPPPAPVPIPVPIPAPVSPPIPIRPPLATPQPIPVTAPPMSVFSPESISVPVEGVAAPIQVTAPQAVAPSPVWSFPPIHHRYSPSHFASPSNSTPDQTDDVSEPSGHNAAMAPAIVAIAALASILLIFLITGGVLWSISGRYGNVRRFMMRFFSESSLPAYNGGDGSDNSYTALGLVDMNDAELWDPDLLEEDADLIDDR